MNLVEYNQKQIRRINRWWLILRFMGLSFEQVAHIWIKFRAIQFHNKHYVRVSHVK